MNTGEICDLPKLVELKQQYKYRLIVDESISLGSLGKTGRGVSEHFGIETNNIDILTATMSNALGSNGGFCAGSKQISEHQRLSGQAYTFSASLPAMLTVACIEAINYMTQHEELLQTLHANVKIMQELMRSGLEHTGVMVLGNMESPIMHLSLRKQQDSRENEEIILQEIVDAVMLLIGIKRWSRYYSQ